METKMIIGIDHGNRNMKTANTVFSAAIQPLQARPDSLEHILEYQNQFYYVGGKVPEKAGLLLRIPYLQFSCYGFHDQFQ